MQLNKIYQFIILFSSLSLYCKGQEITFENERDSIYSIIRKKINGDLLKDSSAIYSFAFKLDIVRKNKKKTIVTKIFANDSIAYKLIPTFEQLTLINYTKLGGSRKKFSLIIPVLIGTYGTKRFGLDKIDFIDESLNSGTKLFFATPDKSMKEGKMPYFKNKMIEPNSEKLIYLYPIVFKLDKKVYD